MSYVSALWWSGMNGHSYFVFVCGAWRSGFLLIPKTWWKTVRRIKWQWMCCCRCRPWWPIFFCALPHPHQTAAWHSQSQCTRNLVFIYIFKMNAQILRENLPDATIHNPYQYQHKIMRALKLRFRIPTYIDRSTNSQPNFQFQNWKNEYLLSNHIISNRIHSNTYLLGGRPSLLLLLARHIVLYFKCL